MEQNDCSSSRRCFFKRGGIVIAAMVGVHSFGRIAQGAEKPGKSKEEISPVEDLMREHGVLREDCG
jgi:hypothetical protein